MLIVRSKKNVVYMLFNVSYKLVIVDTTAVPALYIVFLLLV